MYFLLQLNPYIKKCVNTPFTESKGHDTSEHKYRSSDTKHIETMCPIASPIEKLLKIHV